jgi:hypothetical protein
LFDNSDKFAEERLHNAEKADGAEPNREDLLSAVDRLGKRSTEEHFDEGHGAHYRNTAGLQEHERGGKSLRQDVASGSAEIDVATAGAQE